MSHAANIRNRHRPDQSGPQHLPSSKRRKLSSANQLDQPLRPNGVSVPSTSLVNGAHRTTNTLTAVPTQNARAQNSNAESSARITHGFDDADDVDGEVGGVGVDVDDEDEDEDEEDEEEEEDDDDESSESADEDEDEDDDEAESGDEEKSTHNENLVNGHITHETSDLEANEIQKPADEEPSFGDMLRAKGEVEINVDESFAVSHPAAATSLAPPQPTNRILTVPTANSLGTVLTQALKTNDVDLLESCFQVPNLESIRATIERLHSSHATSLLQRLAERLHKRPGRAGSLMVWVQWTIVTHGGYLASQPLAMKELNTLYQVVKQRALGLQPLLALKGKLDMLEAQMQLRRNIQARSQGRNRVGFEQGVTYVEGQDESDSEEEGDEEEEEEDKMTPRFATTINNLDVRPKKKRNRTRTKGPKPIRKPQRIGDLEDEDDEEDEEEDMPTSLPNGVDIDDLDEDELDSEDDEDDEDLIDDEAEETDDDGSEGLSDEVDYDDNDGMLGEDDDEDEDEDEDDEGSEDDRPTKKSRGV